MAGIIHKDDIRHPEHPQYTGIAKEQPEKPVKTAESEAAERELKLPARKNETK